MDPQSTGRVPRGSGADLMPEEHCGLSRLREASSGVEAPAEQPSRRTRALTASGRRTGKRSLSQPQGQPSVRPGMSHRLLEESTLGGVDRKEEQRS